MSSKGSIREKGWNSYKELVMVAILILMVID